MPTSSGETKVCRDCRLDLPLDKFSRNGRRDGYRRPECRKCQHKRSKAINPNYQYTQGAIEARDAHRLSPDEISKFKRLKLKEQGGQCVYCTAKLIEVACELDHKTPLAAGGTDNLGNLQALCQRCNREKHSKTHDQYIAWLVDIGEHKATDRKPKKLAQ